MVDTGKVSEDNMGKVLSLAAVFYIISSNIVARIINKAPRRVFILLCFVMITVSNILMGPSFTLGLTAYVWPLFYIGQALNGFSQGFLFTPVLPEMMDAIYCKEKLVEGEDDVLDAIVADRCAGYYGLFYAAGTISAPLAGSFVYESVLSKNWE
jgi:MFS family permease